MADQDEKAAMALGQLAQPVTLTQTNRISGNIQTAVFGGLTKRQQIAADVDVHEAVGIALSYTDELLNQTEEQQPTG